MTMTTHAVLGAVIGAATGNPLLAFLFGFGSHFLVDIIPHGDRELYESHKKKHKQKRAYAFVTLDAIIAIMTVALMLGFSPLQLDPHIAAGVIGSVLPDLLIGIYEGFRPRRLRWFHRLHFFFHNLISDRFGDIPLSHAVIAQAIFVLLAQRWF